MYDEFEDYDYEDIGLYEHKRSHNVKWVVSFLLIFVLLAGLIGAWVLLLKPEEPATEQEENTPEDVTEDETALGELYAGDSLTYVFRIGCAPGTVNYQKEVKI